MPQTAAEALLARPPASGGETRYRESIHHPALAEPAIAQGSFAVLPDGRLLRNQDRPRPERSVLGTHIITVTRPDGYENNLPIPEDLAGFLDILRAMFEGRVPEDILAAGPLLGQGPDGWQLVHERTEPGISRIVFSGCGAVLRSLEIVMEGGERRVLAFSAP